MNLLYPWYEAGFYPAAVTQFRRSPLPVAHPQPVNG
jgi:hypothetical protein